MDPKVRYLRIDRNGGSPLPRHHFKPLLRDDDLPCERCGLPQGVVEHRCGDCGVLPGNPHDHGCDIERCMVTGVQWIQCGGWSDAKPCGCVDKDGFTDEDFDDEGYLKHSCGQEPHDCGSEIWPGYWPMARDAANLGFWCRWGPPWIPCNEDHPDASEDLNRLVVDAVWNPATGHWEAR